MNREDRSVKEMWQQYLAAIGEDEEFTDHYTAWHFCDNKEDANELAELVLSGIKRATASLNLSYEYENEDVPRVGDHSVITNWDGVAQCIIRTIKVDVLPYKDVSEDFAATEGEGDKSLDFWRRVHWDYFSREMKEMGRKPSDDMLVLCQEFEVVWR